MAHGDDQVTPRPESLITDRLKFLSREARRALEDRLILRRDDYDCEIFVRIDRIPDIPTKEFRALLIQQGSHWSANNRAIIAYEPERIGRSVVVAGGPFLELADTEKWAEQVALFQDISIQTWSGKPDIEFLIHLISDASAFLFHKCR